MEPETAVPRVKICGITREKDAIAAVRAGADALGFVFHPPSPRYVSPKSAAAIVAGLPPFVTAVGVFVNVPRDQVEEAVAVSGIHLIQFHGAEQPDECTGFDRPVLKAFRFSEDTSLRTMLHYRVAGILVDSGVPGTWGGTGVPLDWRKLKERMDTAPDSLRSRFVLAGGLGPENVGKAIGLLKPYAVDVSSAVEESPGKKSEQRIKEFIHAVQIAGRTDYMA